MGQEKNYWGTDLKETLQPLKVPKKRVSDPNVLVSFLNETIYIKALEDHMAKVRVQ